MAVPWIPLLTLGASLLGGLAGKTDTQSQNQNSTGSQTGIGTVNNAAETKSTSNVTQSQQSNQQSNQTSSETQTGTVTRLDSDTLSLLTDTVRAALAGTNGQSAVTDRIEEISGGGSLFDGDKYVQGVMNQATSRMNRDIESGGNQIASRAGASSRTNSATALLRAKLNQEGASELAGIRAEAERTAAELKRADQESRTSQIGSLSNQQNTALSNMLNSLLGANEQSQQSGTGVTGGTTVGTTTGTTKTVDEQSQLQVQNTLTTAIANEIAKATGKTQSNDWGSLFSSIGGMFKTTF